MQVALAQFAPVNDTERNFTTISGLVREAAERGAELIVFPEEAMLSAEGLDTPLGEIANREWPKFTESVSGLAAAHGLAIVAAGYEANGPDLPYNTMVAFDGSGELLGKYRKMHLYDAFAYQESAYVMRGNEGPQVLDIGGYRMGLMNCYDLRFPEMARVLIEMGAEVLLVSAAWVKGNMKEDHWSTLLRARAIENTCWVVAASSTSSGCIGQSMVVDPMGVIRGSLGDDRAGVQVIEISKQRTADVRVALPVLLNRRIMLVKE
ncbi:carbon-nitrogen hydrolase family protein (plasmid) [Arthrobacter sp. KN11-1C]|uniref:carbon-nitrogen hydrolase family protein n=1 Tax=Arthrobacter sp. KN11-1C TaxID=3445774 RepID=UPI003FA093F1